MDKLQQQLDLEQEMRDLGIKAYMEARQTRDASELKPELTLMVQTIRPLEESITEFVESATKGQARKNASVAGLFLELGIVDTCVLALRTAINSHKTNIKRTVLSYSIGQGIEDEINDRRFKAQNPGLYATVARNLKTDHDGHRKAVKKHVQKKFSIERLELDKADKAKLGIILLDAMVNLGLLKVVMKSEGKNKTVAYVEFEDKIIEWLEASHQKLALLSPKFMPMVVPPNDWTNPFNGGYLNTKQQLVKASKNYLHELLNYTEEMTLVYSGVNALQSTPWRVNRRVYEVMRDLWETTGGGVAGLPLKEGKTLPEKPLDIDSNEEALNEWKSRTRAVHDYNHRQRSKRIATVQKLWLAEKFIDEEAIYFPHNLDWRGRAYPIPSGMSPQGDDAGRGLLEFSEGKPLGEEGVAWLAIHLANTYGYDKVSMDDRIEWTQQNHEMILDSAMFPLTGKKFWLDADKPFQFLAACFEWLGYSIQGESYVSHISVQLDGSCNGLQNFSAMLADAKGGSATNLVPAEKPSDIYSEVAAVTNRMLQENAANGDPVAIAWLSKGGATRSLTKRNTMTQPYGVTQYGMRDQLMEELDKQGYEWEEHRVSTMASYLADLNNKAIRQVVVAAKVAMDWLQEVSKVVTTNNLPISWTTPVGMPVTQYYRKTVGDKVPVMIDGKRMVLTLSVETQEVDQRKSAAGISPNFVHSCDAAHLMRTISMCREFGLTSFSMIHDSYGVHACDTGTLTALLKEAFIEQYSEDVLGKFREEMYDQLVRTGAEELAKKLPPVPPKGELELALIRESDYFFA